MENETYIKLYRKLLNHDVFRDATSFRVFLWILLSVDYKNGTLISGRFWASQSLKMNPNTYYKTLKKLEKNYNLLTLSSNNKNTLISVNNWISYQQSDNNKVTTKEQQSNNKVTLIKNIRNKEIKNIYSSLTCLTDELCSEIAEQYSVNVEPVKKLRDDLIGYCEQHGKRYKNYKATLQNWVRRAVDDKKITKVVKTQIPNVPEISEEQRQKNIKSIAEMKSRLMGGLAV